MIEGYVTYVWVSESENLGQLEFMINIMFVSHDERICHIVSQSVYRLYTLAKLEGQHDRYVTDMSP
jgi:hypothetical protein